MFSRAIQLWNKIWFEPLAPYPLAATRIAFGLYLIGYFLKYSTIVDVAFSSEGVYSPLLIGDIAPEPMIARLIYALALACTVALILGFHTRIAAIATFLLFQYHFYLNFAVTNSSYDRLNTIVLAGFCLTDAGAAWSIDAIRRGAARLVPAWHIRLLQFELAALYFGSGLWKLLNPYWHTGQMLEYTLASPWASPLGFQILALEPPDWFFTACTWAVIAFELLAGFGLYFRRTRPVVMGLGLLFHLSNAVVLLIPEFLNCVTLYPLFMSLPALTWQRLPWLGKSRTIGTQATTGSI
jgi:ABC-type thiamin/hydroxymethylpyrimidine transport system permease subunit